MHLNLDLDPLTLSAALAYVTDQTDREIIVANSLRTRVKNSRLHLLELMEANVPIYGVTTGYGDSCHRTIQNRQSEALQQNLVSYLRCGSGRPLSRMAAKGMCLARLRSLSRGFSGVSVELIDAMQALLAADIVPYVPCEGSLGASGDLIPLAYLAAILQGEEHILDQDLRKKPAAAALREAGLSPYHLKAKEGIALVNGTSAMVGVSLENYQDLKYLTELQTVLSAWLCMSLEGKTEAFGRIVNDQAKYHLGQSKVAADILAVLRDENYQAERGVSVRIKNSHTEGFVQDRYSLRCTPQILGPVSDTLDLFAKWLEDELNGVADNPLIDPDSGELAMGGNFYGGYLSHGMDYLKICIANTADLIDRQLMTVIDDKSNRGLPPNLADWPSLPEDQRHLHHGLKGLHQSVNAITSEIMAMATPNSIFSRSSESHNQDKVSLGMSAAISCQDMLEKLYTIVALQSICLAQAIDLRRIELRGARSKELYDFIRSYVERVGYDQALGEKIDQLKQALKRKSTYTGGAN